MLEKRNHILLISLLSLFGLQCQKIEPEGPANANFNSENIECDICPSAFHPLDVEEIEYESCEDFTVLSDWPTASYFSSETIGFTEDGTYPIILEDGGFAEVNEGNEGIYGVGNLSFSFSGENQTVRYRLYGFDEQYSEMGFSLDEGDLIYLNSSFPLTIDGVTIDLDYSPMDTPPFIYSDLTFTGDISSLEMILFESGITEFCVNKLEIISSNDPSSAIYFTPFTGPDGMTSSTFPRFKTPTGYFSNQPMAMHIAFDQFLGFTPKKITFVRAESPGFSEALVMIQLPNTPLISTTMDSLDYYLSPFGYTLFLYESIGEKWYTEFTPPVSGAIIDSVVISGEMINEITLGMELYEGEIRSICVNHE